MHNQPPKSIFDLLLCQAKNSFCDIEDKEYLNYNMLRILKETQTQFPISVGLFNFHRFAIAITMSFNVHKDPQKLYETKICYHEASTKKCRDSVDLRQIHAEALVKCYLDLADIDLSKQKYP